MSTKTSLRRAILKKIKGLSAARRRAKSLRIFQKLSRERLFRRAEHVAFYYEIHPEVETRPLLKKILTEKKVYLPRVQPAKKVLTLHRVLRLSKDLKKGAYNIMEPKVLCKERPAARMDLIIAPGVAFDKKGGRLGRGGGYYDRLLKKGGRVPVFGLCFREQIVEKVPMEAHDERVDKVITD